MALDGPPDAPKSINQFSPEGQQKEREVAAPCGLGEEVCAVSVQGEKGP